MDHGRTFGWPPANSNSCYAAPATISQQAAAAGRKQQQLAL
jgi:hypothetical protein